MNRYQLLCTAAVIAAGAAGCDRTKSPEAGSKDQTTVVSFPVKDAIVPASSLPGSAPTDGEISRGKEIIYPGTLPGGAPTDGAVYNGVGTPENQPTENGVVPARPDSATRLKPGQAVIYHTENGPVIVASPEAPRQ